MAWGKGDVNPGPERWERARVSAGRHPSWKSTKLYHHRQEAADDFVAAHPELEVGPYEHLNWHTGKREHATHNLRCTALQLMLNHKSALADGEDLVTFLNGEPVVRPYGVHDATCRPLNVETLRRALHCFVCGVEIANPNREKVRIVYRDRIVHVEVPILQAPLTKLYVFTPIDEQMSPVEDARIVPLTAGELTIFEGYMDPAARYRYALVYGRKLLAE